MKAHHIDSLFTGRKSSMNSRPRRWHWPLGALVSLLVFGSAVAETPTAVEAELVTIEAVVEAGKLFAEQNLLRDYTAESFKEASRDWIERAALVPECWVLAAIEDGGEVAIEARIVCRGEE